MTEYAVVNPATGETLATYPTITDDALEAVIEKADAAYRTWRDTPVAERAALVRRVAELHRERRDELAAIIVREMGKPLAAAYGEVDFAADITEYYADNAEKITGDQPLDILGEGSAIIRRSPIGVLLGIMPWNFPYYQVARFAAPNLVIGKPYYVHVARTKKGTVFSGLLIEETPTRGISMRPTSAPSSSFGGAVSKEAKESVSAAPLWAAIASSSRRPSSLSVRRASK